MTGHSSPRPSLKSEWTCALQLTTAVMSIWVEGSIPVTGTAVAAVAVDADVTATAAVVRSAFVYI